MVHPLARWKQHRGADPRRRGGVLQRVQRLRRDGVVHDRRNRGVSVPWHVGTGLGGELLRDRRANVRYGRSSRSGVWELHGGARIVRTVVLRNAGPNGHQRRHGGDAWIHGLCTDRVADQRGRHLRVQRVHLRPHVDTQARDGGNDIRPGRDGAVRAGLRPKVGVVSGGPGVHGSLRRGDGVGVRRRPRSGGNGRAVRPNQLRGKGAARQRQRTTDPLYGLQRRHPSRKRKLLPVVPLCYQLVCLPPNGNNKLGVQLRRDVLRGQPTLFLRPGAIFAPAAPAARGAAGS